MAKALAVRVRFPARSASARSHHLSVVPFFWLGRCASVIELRSSTAKEQLVQTRRYGFDSRPETLKPPLVHPSALSTGRRIGLSYITTWSPVRVRPPELNAGVSQLVEHVIPSPFLIRQKILASLPLRIQPSLNGCNHTFQFVQGFRRTLEFEQWLQL